MKVRVRVKVLVTVSVIVSASTSVSPHLSYRRPLNPKCKCECEWLRVSVWCRHECRCVGVSVCMVVCRRKCEWWCARVSVSGCVSMLVSV